jgi:hypothetical protein
VLRVLVVAVYFAAAYGAASAYIRIYGAATVIPLALLVAVFVLTARSDRFPRPT